MITMAQLDEALSEKIRKDLSERVIVYVTEALREYFKVELTISPCTPLGEKEILEELFVKLLDKMVGNYQIEYSLDFDIFEDAEINNLTDPLNTERVRSLINLKKESIISNIVLNG